MSTQTRIQFFSRPDEDAPGIDIERDDHGGTCWVSLRLHNGFDTPVEISVFGEAERDAFLRSLCKAVRPFMERFDNETATEAGVAS